MRGWVAMLVVLSACKHGSPITPASQVVGAAGGTVTLADGTSVLIPAGALGTNTSITIAPTSAPSIPGETIVGPAYVLGPEGTQFAQPVTVTLPFVGNELPAGATPSDVVMFTAPVGSADFTSLGGVTTTSFVSAQTTHFSVFVPVVHEGGSLDMGDGDMKALQPQIMVTPYPLVLTATRARSSSRS